MTYTNTEYVCHSIVNLLWMCVRCTYVLGPYLAAHSLAMKNRFVLGAGICRKWAVCHLASIMCSLAKIPLQRRLANRCRRHAFDHQYVHLEFKSDSRALFGRISSNSYRICEWGIWKQYSQRIHISHDCVVPTCSYFVQNCRCTLDMDIGRCVA